MKAEENYRRTDEFQEIIIEDRSPNTINLENSNNPGFQGVPVGYLNQQGQNENVLYSQVRRLANLVKVGSVTNSILCFTFIVSGIYILSVLSFLPVIGYFGAQRLNRRLLILYLVFTAFIIIIRLGLIRAAVRLEYIFVAFISTVFSIIFFVYSVKLIRIIGKITSNERLEILELMNKPYDPRREKLQNEGPTVLLQPEMQNVPRFVGVPMQFQQQPAVAYQLPNIENEVPKLKEV